MRAYERLLNYAAVNTTSYEGRESVPSGEGEFLLADLLAGEMRALGLIGVYRDENAYVYGFLPATEGCENVPGIGFIAHLDTVDDCGGTDTHPQIIANYDGGPVPLGTSGKILDPVQFPHLRECVGKTLLTTDGTSVLGSDDKSGIAEIMTFCERLIEEGRPHGRICVCFTPDEEIGHGASLLDLDAFGADLAYTVDGSSPGEIEYETFNAAAAKLTFHGLQVHPGYAKGKMINAMRLAMEADAMLPPDEVPEKTEGREGYYHLTECQGTVTQAVSNYILRDHDAVRFEIKKQMMQEIADRLNEKYGPGTVQCQVRDQYRNMAEIIARHPEVVTLAEEAIRSVGLIPRSEPIRGGTDGAQLTYRGLPCPNLGTGGYAFHGIYEHAVVEEMDICVEILLHLAEGFVRATLSV